MEIMLNSTYDGYFEFKNNKLKTATEKLFKAGKALASNYATIGKILIDVKESEIFKDDFKSFGEYVNDVLGISQSTAYGMMSVCTRFLLPETSKDSNTFFTRFADTALYALLPLKMSYEETKEFCTNNDINETTPVADIKRTVKAVVTPAKDTENTKSTDTDTDSEPNETINNKTGNVKPADKVKAVLTAIINSPDTFNYLESEDGYTTEFAQLFRACREYFNM